MIAGAFAAAIITAGASAQLGGGDECASAVTVSAGVPVAFNTTTATASGNIPVDTLCASSFLNWIATCPDVWFKYTATGPGLVDFSTCDAASYDTSMALYQSSCSNLVACNGDGSGLAGCQGYYSLISGVACVSGDVFYVRIGGYNGDFGPGTLTVTFTASSAGCVGATGACDVVHAGFGCNNAVCCTSICTFNPLCCEVGWDQGCVDLAVSTCGYYSCPAVAGAPVNNCANSPTVIPALSSTRSFTNVGATTDGPIQSAYNCSNVENDIWYKVSPVANGTMTASVCGSVPFDSMIAAYDLGTTPATFDYNLLGAALIGCNDDGDSGTCMTTSNPASNYASELSVTVALGHTYLVRLGSYTLGDTGAGSIAFTLPTACALDTSSGSEGEPCGSAYNNGCNAAGQTTPFVMGSTIAGTFWADAATRDTDFYSFTVAAGSQVTVSVKAARLATVLVLSGNISTAACAGVTTLASGTGACPSVATYCLNPGVYYAFVADAAYEGNPCNSGAFNDYTIKITSAPATCPILVSGGAAINGSCAAPGPNTMTLNTDPNAVTSGLVACAVGNPAFPNCNVGGGTTANAYARVFPAGTVGGNISCINFGAYATVRGSTGTACATYYSDIPLPATIGIYQDLDGGAPRYVTADHGVDGGDLDKIADQAVSIPGGVYVATLNFAQPICVDQYHAKNLVVIMDIPSLYAGAPGVPAAKSYGLRAGGNAAGPGGNTYCRLSCADTGAFVTTETVGAAYTAQWVCAINGNNAASCSAPACAGDYNGDHVRNGADLATLLSAWGTPAGDITGDGNTNGADLSTLLSGWGACPN